MIMDAESEAKEIFISYGREPGVIFFVKQLKRDLEHNGFSVWMDAEDIPAGSDWHGAIGVGLTSCQAIIPVITQKYIGSRFCINELYTADGDKKHIFPVMYEDVDFDSTDAGKGIKFVISSINWTMFRPRRDDYDKSLRVLVQGMREKGVGEPSAEVKQVTVSVGPTSSEPVMRIPDINSPQNVAVGKNGEIVVTSYQSHEVLVYSKEGKLVTKFGGQGFTEGKFLCPSGVAVDEDNNILVACYHKLQRFTIDGQFIDGIGGQGQGELEFMVPSGVAIDKEGKIYVAEMMNNRVQVLNADLTYHGSFSKASESLGSGRLNQPQGVAVNSEGKVFVADTMNHAVQVFSQKGEFLFKFGKSGTMMEPGVTSTPMAVAIDLQDNVYVGSATGTISIFSKDGEFVMSFGGYGSELGKFSTIRGMHIDKRGLLYVCEWITNRIQVFQCFSHAEQNKEDVATTAAATAQLASNQELHVDTTKGDSEHTPPKLMPPLKPAVGPKSLTPIKILEDIEQAEGITTGHHGEIVVTSFEEHKVLIYSEDFELITEFSGMSLPQEDRFLCPRSVAVFDNNSLLLLGVDTLQKLTLEGELLASMGKLKKGKGPLEFGQPSGIAIGKDGRVYISEVDNQRIQILNSDFTHCGFAVNPELTKKAKDSPQALAINSEGNVYMVDQGNSNVQVFSPEGKFLFKFGKHGSPIVWGALTSPMALAIDCRDNVYVGNATGIISIFNKEGKFVRSFGAHGEEPGEFYLIRGMHVDKKDRLYVCEWTTNRVQVFQL